MNKEEIIEKIKQSNNHKVKVAITDIDGVLRGKYIHIDKFLSIKSKIRQDKSEAPECFLVYLHTR